MEYGLIREARNWQIEAIPLPDASLDVIISNSVINLSADKRPVLAETFRVLKPGGRFAVADIVVHCSPLPERLRQAMALWAGCLAGALTEDEYRPGLAAAGFAGVDVQVLQGCTPQTLTRAASYGTTAMSTSRTWCCSGAAGTCGTIPHNSAVTTGVPARHPQR